MRIATSKTVIWYSRKSTVQHSALQLLICEVVLAKGGRRSRF